MEEIHGVDVSWLHHSAKADFADHYAQKSSVPAADGHPGERTTLDPAQSNLPSPFPEVNGASPSQSHSLHRSVSEKVEVPATIPAKSQKDPKPVAPGRKSSWVSSISSKFSSSSNTAPPKAAETHTPVKSSKSPPSEHVSSFGAAVPPSAKEKKAPESPASTPPSSPKLGHGFLQNAMRRLSSSGGTVVGKVAGNGGVCQRKTMNIDPYRERCSLPELELKKLRRVAFCVDVEIAGAAQYPNTEPEGPKSPPPSESMSSLTRLEHQIEERRQRRDHQLKKSEGEALKRPIAVVDEKEIRGMFRAAGEKIAPENNNDPKPPEVEDTKDASKKKQKKKRSESERKERKEKKHRDAFVNGRIPAEIHREGSGSSTTDSPTRADASRKSQDRPTTDPLRIYRRCCQLRETPILKRIAEQISSPSACHIATPAIVSTLDLSGYWMQLSDVITLGDYLAVVPVKRLIMENCGLGDEAVRVVLAGLLAAKTPEQAKFNKKLCKRSATEANDATERLGVIEKVSLKNNPKIGKEGWRY
ncbi:MAG: hypothetical protein Q9164_003280 [Protoblastenia rupestris]